MPDLIVSPRLTIAESELQISWARSSGPGGQNVNKVNSKITLKWSPGKCEALPAHWRDRFQRHFASRINHAGEVVIQSEKFRDQPRNLADARRKLVDMLLLCEHPPKVRKKTKPSKGSQRRRMDAKSRNSQKKRLRQRPRRDD